MWITGSRKAKSAAVPKENTEGGVALDRKLQLRKVQPCDMDLLFRWANDDTVRANAFHTEKIPYENHVQWFEKMMADASVYQYILCDGNVPIGQIRLTDEEGAALIDYSVAPMHRGKGYGTELLRLLCRQLYIDRITNVTKLIGQVKYQNQASARVFEKSGFRKTMLPEYIQYEKEMSR